MPRSIAQVAGFMQKQQVASFCTVDIHNRPHVVPVFFTYENNKVFIHTDRKSQKVHNLLKNPHVALTVYSGGHGEEAVIIRGKARIVDNEEFVSRTQQHIEKYQIQLDNEGKDSMGIGCFDSVVRCVVEISTDRLIYW